MLLQHLHNFLSKLTHFKFPSTGQQLCAGQRGAQFDSSCQEAPAVLPWICVSQGVSLAIAHCQRQRQPGQTESEPLPYSLVLSSFSSIQVCLIIVCSGQIPRTLCKISHRVTVSSLLTAKGTHILYDI